MFSCCVCISNVWQLIERHLGFLCLACLVIPDHFLALQRIHMFFVSYCSQFLLYICLSMHLLFDVFLKDNAFIFAFDNCCFVTLENKF